MQLGFAALHDDEWYEKGLLAIFRALWMLSMFVIFRTALCKNVRQHRAWAVRFALYTHTIPVIARILFVIPWWGTGKPSGRVDPPMSLGGAFTFSATT